MSCSLDDALLERREDAADDLGVDAGVVSVLPRVELASLPPHACKLLI